VAEGQGTAVPIPHRLLTHRLLTWASERPDATAYICLNEGDDEARRLTFAELAARGAGFAARLHEICAPGDRLLLAHEDPATFAVALTGCLLAGVVAVPVPESRRGAERLAAIAASARPAAVLRRDHVDDGTRCLTADDVWSAATAPSTRDTTPDQLAIIQYTSGSTGSPNGVLLTYDILAANLAMISAACGVDERGVIVSWLPLFHDMGLIGNVLLAMHLGVPCVLMSPGDFIARPGRWLRAISRYGGTMSGAPSFAYEFCARRVADDELATLDLSSWSCAYVSAEPVRAEALDAFATRFARAGFDPTALYPCYGLAEATLIVAGGRRGAGPVVRGFDEGALTRGQAQRSDDGRRLVGCGRGIHGTDVRIVDPRSGSVCAPGVVGEVWVRGPAVAAGYHDDAAGTRQRFAARIAGDSARHVRTGDLGFVDDGELFLTGRRDDLIIVRGLNHYPQDIERTALHSSAVLVPGCGVAVPDDAADVMVIHELRDGAGDPGEIAETVRAAVAREHGLGAAVALLRRGGLLKTTSGKPRRRANRAALRAGKLPVIWQDGDPSSRPALPAEGVVAEAAAQVLGTDRLDPGRPLVAQGLNSLAATTLAERLAASRHAISAADLLADRPLRELRPAAQAPTPAVHHDTGTPTAGEAALLFLEECHAGTPVLHQSRVVALAPDVDRPALAEACRRLVAAHPGLRARFPTPGERDVAAAADVWERVVAADDVPEQVRRELDRPFDLTTGPCRFVLLDGPRPLLVLALHHVAVDLASLPVLLNDLGAHYTAVRTGAPARAPLPDVRPRLATTEQLAYWCDVLTPPPVAADLPLDHPRPTVRSGRGATCAFDVDSATVRRLHGVASNAGATRYAVLLAALAGLLVRLTGRHDLVVGAPASIRPPAATGTIGMFSNPLPVRVNLSDDPPLTDVVRRCRQAVAAALDHRDAPFADVVASVAGARDGRRFPLIDVFLGLHEAPGIDDTVAALAAGTDGPARQFGELLIRPVAGRPRGAQADLAFELAPCGGGLRGVLQYDTDLFDAPTARALADRFVAVLGRLGADATGRLADLDAACDADRHAWQRARGVGSAPATRLDEAVCAQASRTPGATAVVATDRCLTYAEVARRSAAVARALRRAGVRRGDVVATMLGRDSPLVPGLLGVLRAGAAYLPLDQGTPDERIRVLVRDAAAVLTSAGNAARACGLGAPVVEVPVDLAGDPPPRLGSPDDTAYVLYTSGSTGTPNGVEISHRALHNLLVETARLLALGPTDRWLAITSLGFDVAQAELLAPLLYGGAVIIGDDALLRDPRAVLDAAADPAVTVLQATPSRWRQLVAEGWRSRPGLRLISAGERLDAALATALTEGGGALWNCYGPTEATVYVSAARIDAAELAARPVALSAGRPFAGVDLTVVDRHRARVPVGTVGELTINGVALAKGYRGDPRRTAARFVPDPHAAVPGARCYRTGDRARMRRDGAVEILGRADGQLKIAGVRIEPGEVEAALLRHPAVRAAAVALRPQRSGPPRLVAHVVGDAARRADIHAAAAAVLPTGCAPAQYVFTDRLPMSPAGKLLRSALVEPEPAPTRALDDSVQARVAAIWQRVLGTAHAGPDDNFFEVGGHSLLLADVRRLVEHEFGRPVRIQDLMAHTTIRALASWLAGLAPAPAGPVPDGRMRLAALRGRSMGSGT
jgi:nonribosomal peptide synthetase protein BlmVI